MITDVEKYKLLHGAVENFINVKGRYHTEQACNKLIRVFDEVSAAPSEPSIDDRANKLDALLDKFIMDFHDACNDSMGNAKVLAACCKVVNKLRIAHAILKVKS